MKDIKEIKIDNTLRDALQARSIELSGLERLIGFALSSSEYKIPQDKVDELMEKHKKCNAEYELLKQQVSNFIKKETGKDGLNWNLDFESCIVTLL